MKKILIITMLLAASFLFTACDKEETSITPSGITDIQSFEIPGEIGLTWKRNEPVNFDYIQIKYFDHLRKMDISFLASPYTDTVIIPNTRAKYGDYTFTFQPFSSTRTGGDLTTIKAKSGPYLAKISLKEEKTKVELTADMLSTDFQEASEGPIADLVDGDPNTYFHTDWHGKPFPHSFKVDLGNKKVRGLSFYFKNRHNNGNGCPKAMSIQGSNDGTNWENIIQLTADDNMPNGKGTEYDSPSILAEKEYSKFQFVITETHTDGGHWFSLAEFELFEHEVSIYDPENSDEDI